MSCLLLELRALVHDGDVSVPIANPACGGNRVERSPVAVEEAVLELALVQSEDAAPGLAVLELNDTCEAIQVWL